jgi:hypothetical protein
MSTRHDLATADVVPALDRFDVDSTAFDETWGMDRHDRRVL